MAAPRLIVDRQILPLPINLAPGQYRLVIGWYYPPTGDRLPLTANDLPGESGNTAQVGVVTIN
jgi:hypothetical protein